jgi:hypothetical protein
MIPLQQATDSLNKMEELIKNAQAAVNQAQAIANEPKILVQIIALLDIIIWPLTLIASLFLFKNHIGRIINSLGSIKAGPTGLELNFIEDKLQEATKLIGIGSSSIIPKDGGAIRPKDGGSIRPKDGGSIKRKSDNAIISKIKYAETPYQELLELQDLIHQKLKNITLQNEITVSGSSSYALTNDLLENEIINMSVASKLKTLLELTSIGLNSPNITYDQVIQMRKLFNNIRLD